MSYLWHERHKRASICPYFGSCHMHASDFPWLFCGLAAFQTRSIFFFITQVSPFEDEKCENQGLPNGLRPHNICEITMQTLRNRKILLILICYYENYYNLPYPFMAQNRQETESRVFTGHMLCLNNSPFFLWYLTFNKKYIWLTEDSNSVLSEGQNFWLVTQSN